MFPLTSKRIALLIAMMAIPFWSANDCAAQDQTKFILTLNEQLVGNMKSLGSLNSAVPEDAQGRVAVIELKFETTDLSAESLQSGPVTEVVDGACMLDLDDDLLDKAKNNTLRFEVPEGADFSKVFLNYPLSTMDDDKKMDGDSMSPAESGSSTAGSSTNSVIPDPSLNNNQMQSSPMSGSASHYITLSGNRTIDGKMEITGKLSFETKFGDVGIGVDQIKGIRFHVDGDDSAVIVLKNGDTITGIPKLDNVTLNTEWGRAEVETKYIESVVTTPNARFQPNSNLGGPGWILLN